MQGAQTSVAQEDQEGSGRDLRSPVISVEKLILFHSSLPRADQYCAAIALVRAAQLNNEPESRTAKLQSLPITK